MTTSSAAGPPGAETVWLTRLAQAIRYVLAPALLAFSGFFTTDFVLSGVYTWPRTSRILVLTLTVVILSWEFVFKEQRARYPDPADPRPIKALIYSCMIPYATGCVALMLLARRLF